LQIGSIRSDTGRQPANYRDLPWMLRLGPTRREESARQQGQQAAATVHYSIT
jgi:hypothetical protein